MTGKHRGKMGVRRKTNSKAGGCKVCCSTTKSTAQRKIKVISSKSQGKTTIFGLRSGKKYCVSVRLYKKSYGKTYYSAKSAVRTISVK